MNVADSREYKLALEGYSFTPSETPFDTDLLIVNTCSVRAKAEEKLVSFLGAAEAAIATNPRLKVGLVGCTATLKGDELRRRFPAIKFILPATDVEGFAVRLLEQFPGLSPFALEGQPSVDEQERFERFITVMRGCDSFCAYCVVPYARGPVRSLPLGDIFARCDAAVEAGCKVITLLGQNVMAYGRNAVDAANTPVSFLELLREIAERYPDTWIKFLTSHPRDVTRELVDFIARNPNISRHFHLPIQSGDDRVLSDMNRGYTSTDYRGLIEYIREKIPDSRISTDMIAGFPTEDDEAFQNTLTLARELGFEQMFTFQYSPRQGTAAAKWEDPVPFEEKRKRLEKLIELQNEIVRKKHHALIGKRMPALVYGVAEKVKGVAAVSRESHVIILADADIKPGTIVDVEITEGLQRTLRGIVAR